MKMSFELLDEAYMALAPWDMDTRTPIEREQDEDKRLEDYYLRTIEAYDKQKALIEEIENDQRSQ